MRHFLIFASKRLLFVPASVFIVVTLAFGIVNLVPSDPAQEIAGGLATGKQLEEIRKEIGFDRPLLERYKNYIVGLARADLGTSYYSKRPIIDEIGQFLPNTIELVILSILFATICGISIGSMAAYFQGKMLDRSARVLIAVVQSLPEFFLALILIYVFFFLLGWAPPPVGRLDLLDPYPERVTGALLLDTIILGEWDLFVSALYHSLLPVLTLGLFYSAYFAKLSRSVMSSALSSHQVEFARACGLPERKVFAYAFRAARTPIITYLGILTAALIGGAAIVETIFAWGGIGQWAIVAILKLDVPAIQGFILVTGLFTLLIFLILDILVIFLDPRVSIA